MNYIEHNKDETFNSESTINGFVKTGIASLSFMKLAKDNWNWGDYSSSNKITFSDAVSDVKNNLVSNPDSYDYYVVAEPVLTAARLAKAHPLSRKAKKSKRTRPAKAATEELPKP